MFRAVPTRMVGLLVVSSLLGPAAFAGENWLQLKYDCRHSGDVPDRSVKTPLGLVGAVALTDAVYTAPLVADARVYVVDGAGVAYCLDAAGGLGIGHPRRQSQLQQRLFAGNRGRFPPFRHRWPGRITC